MEIKIPLPTKTNVKRYWTNEINNLHLMFNLNATIISTKIKITSQNRQQKKLWNPITNQQNYRVRNNFKNNDTRKINLKTKTYWIWRLRKSKR